MIRMKFRPSSAKTLLPLILLGVILVTACDKKNPVNRPTDEGVGRELTIDASNTTEWVYFNFSSGETVTVENPANSMDWDLGLRRYHLSTNSGTSGSGKGGAIDMGKVRFEEVSTAPTANYAVDDSIAYQTHGGGTSMYSENPVLKNWATMEGMPPTFVPSDHIYCVKTADGKYVKLWLKSYYDAEGNSGHITIKYYYQPDGSTDLSE
jgi:hypothetical protein